MVKDCEYFIARYIVLEDQFHEMSSLQKQKDKNFKEALDTLTPDGLYNLYTFLEMTIEKGVMLRALDRAARKGHRLAIRKRAKYVVCCSSGDNSGCIQCGICTCSKARILAKGENILCTTRCDDYSCLLCPIMDLVVVKAL